MTRKEFLKTLGIGTPALLCAPRVFGATHDKWKNERPIKGRVFKGNAPSRPWKWSIEAFHYTVDGRKVQCEVCPHRCVLSPGDRSICRSRVNIDGKLYSLAYGNPCAIHLDPIEKKPLNHFYPGTSVFSIATTGCNFRCLNCQNWEISQRRPEDVHFGELFPDDVVRETKKRRIPTIAYTYSEAVTYYEYTYNTAKRAGEAGIKNVLVSNGYINEVPLVELSKFLDGANIDLKSFDDRIYQCLSGGHLQPILDTLKTLHEEKVWFEITTLVVPSYVDDPDMIRRMCGWILKEIGPDYPLHFSRFVPLYKLTRLPSTPVETLERLRELALREGLHFVYLGNVPGHEGCHTYCPQCGKLLIGRNGYSLSPFNIEKGRCRFCNASIPGRWETASAILPGSMSPSGSQGIG